MAEISLKGHEALITGAGGLMGMMHARALLQCGIDRLVMTDVEMFELNMVAENFRGEFPNTQIDALFMDVAHEPSVSDTSKSLPNINILINNAALNPKVEDAKLSDKTLANFNVGDWDKELDVGLKGTFLCCKHFGSRMASKTRGTILNIGSDLSIISPDQRLYKEGEKPITYSVVKHGVVGLTKYLATYWGADGVRVNCLCPGGVYNHQDANFVARVCSRIPMGRMATLNDYIGAVQFLCSDMSKYMTGQNLIIDGGRTVW